jgi:hypothetical protein
MYIPSYDFDLFDLPQFSPLQAQEFGAETSFRANTPLSFVDWSLNQFAGLMNPRAAYPYVQSQFPSEIDMRFGQPFFQGAEDVRERLRRVRDEANRVLVEAGGNTQSSIPAPTTKSSGCPTGYSPVSVFGLFSYCGKDLKSDDSSVGTTNPSGDRIGDATKDFFANLPPGAGIFLIAVVVIILLLLFVRK